MNDIAVRGPHRAPAPLVDPTVPRELATVKLGEPPQSIAEAIYWARTLVMASLLPDGLRDKRTGEFRVADVVLLIAYGAELQLSPLQAINAIYVVKGRPHISAQLWAQRIRAHRHTFEISVDKNPDGLPQAATAYLKRHDDGTEHEVTFTLADAARAGLVQRINEGKAVCRDSQGRPQPWELYTERMLVCRASSHCGRFGAPEAVLGFSIKGEEFNELEPDDGFDEFVSKRAVTGAKPALEPKVDEQAEELAALAERFAQTRKDREEQDDADKVSLGAILKGVKDRAQAVPRTGEQEQAYEEWVEAQNRVLDADEATCEVCGRWMPKADHPDDDHEPLWVLTAPGDG